MEELRSQVDSSPQSTARVKSVLRSTSSPIKVNKSTLKTEIWDSAKNFKRQSYKVMHKDWFIKLVQKDKRKEKEAKLKVIAPWFDFLVISDLALEQFDLVKDNRLLWLSPRLSYIDFVHPEVMTAFNISVTTLHVVHCIEINNSLFQQIQEVTTVKPQLNKEVLQGLRNIMDESLFSFLFSSTDGCGKIIYSIKDIHES